MTVLDDFLTELTQLRAENERLRRENSELKELCANHADQRRVKELERDGVLLSNLIWVSKRVMAEFQFDRLSPADDEVAEKLADLGRVLDVIDKEHKS